MRYTTLICVSLHFRHCVTEAAADWKCNKIDVRAQSSENIKLTDNFGEKYNTKMNKKIQVNWIHLPLNRTKWHVAMNTGIIICLPYDRWAVRPVAWKRLTSPSTAWNLTTLLSILSWPALRHLTLAQQFQCLCTYQEISILSLV